MSEWKLQLKDGSIMPFREHFQDFAITLQGNDIDEFVPTPFDRDIMQIVHQFIEQHNYDASTITASKPLKSANFQDNVDHISFALLKDFTGIQNVERLKPILEAAYFLQFKELKEICFCALGSELYIGNTEEELQQFIHKHNISDLTPEEELKIMQDYPMVFRELNKKLREDILKEENKYRDLAQEANEQAQQIEQEQVEEDDG